MDKKQYERQYYQEKTKYKKREERNMIRDYPELKKQNKKLLIKTLYLETVVENLENCIEKQKLLIDSYCIQLNHILENNKQYENDDDEESIITY